MSCAHALSYLIWMVGVVGVFITECSLSCEGFQCNIDGCGAGCRIYMYSGLTGCALVSVDWVGGTFE